MRMIKISAFENGAHDNQTCHGIIPEGWAVIPDDMKCENFPFGTVQVEVIDDVPTVISWTPGTMPEPEPTITTDDVLNALLGVTTDE